MKRYLVLLGLLLLVTVSAMAVEIVFWYPLSGSKGEVFKQIVEEFNRSHPSIQV